MTECHDVVFGLYYLHHVMYFYTYHTDFADNIVIKKIFIDTYSKCLVFVMFRQGTGEHKDWVFPLLCVQDNSYAYTIFWYEWIIESMWNFDSDDSNDEDKEF